MWNPRLGLERNPHAQVQVYRIADRRHPKELKSGIKAETLCRKQRISGAMLYNCRAKYNGLDVSDLRQLKELEDENRRLKKIVADQALNIEVLKMVAEGKILRPVQRRSAVRAVQERFQVAERAACRWLDVNRKLLHYQSRRQPDEPLRSWLIEKAGQHCR